MEYKDMYTSDFENHSLSQFIQHVYDDENLHIIYSHIISRLDKL